ncbi:NAD-dependent protein deacetylase sirtuin-2 [Blyttiomyces sp. JEL0837]|nr:NAD-dependent protein deacetylase sirtuin-2 [Blyttiomyces sp. JEL0837]
MYKLWPWSSLPVSSSRYFIWNKSNHGSNPGGNSTNGSGGGCGKTYTQEWMIERILSGELPTCENCNGIVKPDVTFFGEQLPSRFHSLFIDDFKQADALIVMGSSLQVQPVASLISRVNEDVPRLLINLEISGDLEFDFAGVKGGFRRDSVYLGPCDEGVTRLAELLGVAGKFRRMASFEEEDNGGRVGVGAGDYGIRLKSPVASSDGTLGEDQGVDSDGDRHDHGGHHGGHHGRSRDGSGGGHGAGRVEEEGTDEGELFPFYRGLRQRHDYGRVQDFHVVGFWEIGAKRKVITFPHLEINYT